MCPCTSTESELFDIPTEVGDIVPVGFVYDSPALLFREPKAGTLGTELMLDSPYATIRVDGVDHQAVKAALERLNTMVLRNRKISFH